MFLHPYLLLVLPETSDQSLSPAFQTSHNFGFFVRRKAFVFPEGDTPSTGIPPNGHPRPKCTRRHPNTTTMAAENKPIAKKARISGGDPAAEKAEFGFC